MIDSVIILAITHAESGHDIIYGGLVTEAGFLSVTDTLEWNIHTSYSYFIVHKSTEVTAASDKLRSGCCFMCKLPHEP